VSEVKRPAAKKAPAKTAPAKKNPARKAPVKPAALPAVAPTASPTVVAAPAKKVAAKKVPAQAARAAKAAVASPTVAKKTAVKKTAAKEAPAPTVAVEPVVKAPRAVAKPAAARKTAAQKAALNKTVTPKAVQPPAAAPVLAPSPARKRPAARLTAQALPLAPPSPPVEAVALPVLPVHSEICLQADAWGQQLRWLPGSACPEGVLAQAQALLGPDGSLDPQHDAGLLALQHSAAQAGHPLQIASAVWAAVAADRDVRWRVHHLEQAYPEGVASPALHAVLQHPQAVPLAPFQFEGALFAACAGRAVLADEPGLGHGAQALAAAVLLARHFGVQRLGVLCPPSQLLAWEHAEVVLSHAAADLQVRLCSDAGWAGAHTEWAAWAPELLIVDDTGLGLSASAAAGVRQLHAPYAWVLRTAEPASQPEALADWLAWLDPHQLGVSRQFLARHRAPEGLGWQGLERWRDTLAPVMLRRTRSRCLQPLPGRRDPLVWAQPAAPLDPQALRVLQAVCSRWQRVAYVSDQEQWALREALAALHAASSLAPAATPGVSAKSQALLELLPQLLDTPHARVLVLAEAPALLGPARAALLAAGFDLAEPGQAQPEARLRLGLDSQSWDDEASWTPTAVVGLDLPWSQGTLRRRVSCAPGAALVHLLAMGGLDEQRLRLQLAQPAAGAALATDPARPFLQGPALAQWMDAVAALVLQLSQP